VPSGWAPVDVAVGEIELGKFWLPVLLADVELDARFAGVLGPTGSTEGGGTSGTPEGRLMGVHSTPPGPIKIVTGLL